MVVLINLPVPLKRDVTSPLSVTVSRLPTRMRHGLLPAPGSQLSVSESMHV